LVCLWMAVGAQGADAPPSDLLRDLVADKWGADRVAVPTVTTWVQYQADLGERWIIDFKSGEVAVECLWLPSEASDTAAVRDAMAGAVSNMYFCRAIPPVAMLRRQQQAGRIPARVPYDQLQRQTDHWVYTVRAGDTLSGLARRFRVRAADLIALNAIVDPNRIRITQRLIIPEPRPHMHLPGEAEPPAEHRLLCDQVVDPDTGNVVHCADMGRFSRKLVVRNGVEQEELHGADGRIRQMSRVRIRLGKNHLSVRARRFYPLIREHAVRFGHDPALIMAMVHTESAFNPMAASSANAYGLMQLVPTSGGREAYSWLHKKDLAPSPAYLLRPRENIELGTAYLRLLQDRIFKGVQHPDSRLYCAVAAYNGGGGSVGKAFTGSRAVSASLVRINAATPLQVLKRLRSSAPRKETRDYMQRVFERAPLYRPPLWPPAHTAAQGS
jgi:LysM repeat protein